MKEDIVMGILATITIALILIFLSIPVYFIHKERMARLEMDSQTIHVEKMK